MTLDWQNFSQVAGHPPFVERFAARMPDGRFLDLPLRQAGDVAVADFMADQASFLIVDALAEWLARAVRPLRPDIVIGLAGGGAILAAETARRLSHLNWVMLAERASPADGGARWRLDPALLPRLRGRRALLVHDALGHATELASAAAVLKQAGAATVAIAVAMVQADRWVGTLPADVTLVAVFATPGFQRAPGGWVPNEDSAVWRVCPLFRQGAMAAAAAPSPAPPRTGIDPA